MKAWLAVLLAVAVQAAETNKVALTEAQLEEKFTQAVMLARVGLYEEAEAVGREILAQKPDQPTVKQLLAEIAEQRNRIQSRDPGYALRRKLDQIVVPEIRFREAAMIDVVQYLSEQSKQLAPDKTQINFVWLVPDDFKPRAVTLNLHKVPMSEVLNYVTQLSGLKYRVDAHAVVIYKPEPEKPIPPATEPNAIPK
jgi:hypothetical protein